MTEVKKIDWLKSYQRVIAKKVKRFTWTTLLMTEYAVLRGEWIGEGVQIKPDIIVAGVPVWHINKIGHAASDEVLKYRSMGGIFLAHQKGGKHTFKFTARIFGPMRFITYKLLEALQLLGTEEVKHVKNLVDLQDIQWHDEKKNLIKPEDQIEAGSLGSPLIDYTNTGGFQDEDYGYHRTFPIITETRIYTDMYLETLVMREDVKYGKNVMEIQCAFRQYIPPTSYQKTRPNPTTDRQYYSVFVPDKMANIFQRMDLLINLGWSTRQLLVELLNERPELMYQKAEGKFIWEASSLLAALGVHLAFSFL